MSSLVIAHREEKLNELCALGGPDATFVAVSPFARTTTGTKTWTSSLDYASSEDITATEWEAVRWLKELAHAPIAGIGSLVHALAMDGTSLWWFGELAFHRFGLKTVARTIAWLEPTIGKLNPDRLVFVDDGTILVATLRAVSAAHNIPAVALPYRPWLTGLTPKRLGPRIGERVVRPARDELRRVVGLARKQSWRDQPNGRPRILVASMAREELLIDRHSGDRVHGDLMLGPLLGRLNHNCDLQTTFLYKFPYWWRLKVPRDLRDLTQFAITWESLSGRRARQAIRRRVRIIKRVRRELWHSPDFQINWTFAGIPIWSAVRRPLRKLWARELTLVAKHLVLSGELLDSLRPDGFLVAGEMSSDNKALVYQCHRRNIPVVAIQHGNITMTEDYLVDYSATPQDLEGTPSKADLFPDRLCISGLETLDILTNGVSYPYPDRLVVTGQARLDPLFDPESHLDRAHFLKAFGIDGNRPVVLVGSQLFSIAGDRRVFMGAILDALRNEADLTIVVKPHPLERALWHKRYIKRRGIRAVVLPANVSAKAALFASDVLLTFYSTIATEAIVLDRPVVIVNLTGRPAPVNYAQHGVAIEATSGAEILPATRQALYDQDVRSVLKERRRDYLQYESGTDAGATERIMQVAAQTIRLPEGSITNVECPDT